ncbi:phage head closure protein [Caulobacter sp. DWR3-1-2]|uniref:phage head closure protein n=1 Tax=Caulobacter sp. DWR3-1-2 TaxID=2804647 RepID=UPI003CEB4444
MKAGDLDRRITLQPRVLTKDPFNADVETWPDLTTVWASYEPVKDGERFRANETAATITARFQIRWSGLVASLSPADRLNFDNRSFDIVAVKEIGRREGLEISATARAERAA